jgi:signal transduction histidine kinase/YHS domain-containing protein
MSNIQQPDPQADQLQELQRRAEAMTRGDFSALGQPVGGSRAVEDLRRALDVMGTHVEQAQGSMQAYIAALTTAQEAERGRIARELHDDTVQRLVALGQGVERAQRLVDRDPHQTIERLTALRSEITSMVQAVRTIIGDLRPPALEELGLVPAIKLLIGRSGESPEVDMIVEGVERRLDPQSELALFRILQEAWNNILRHAQATQVELRFKYARDALHVTLADDGRGFTQAGDGRSLHRRWGLVGMQERAGLVGGLVQVASEAGKGTRVTIHMPYPGRDGRDPICGMEVGPDAISAEYAGVLYRFCSAPCRELFLAAPEQYIHRPASDTEHS